MITIKIMVQRDLNSTVGSTSFLSARAGEYSVIHLLVSCTRRTKENSWVQDGHHKNRNYTVDIMSSEKYRLIELVMPLALHDQIADFFGFDVNNVKASTHPDNIVAIPG